MPLSITSGSTIEIKNSTGNVLFSATAVKTANSVIFAAPELTSGQTYYLYINGTQASTATAAGVASVTSTVAAVTVTPNVVILRAGDNQKFTATVSGTNNPSQAVAWTVIGGVTGTTITSDGTLTIATNETADTLVVKAVSIADTNKSATAMVTMSQDVSAEPNVISIDPSEYVSAEPNASTDPSKYVSAEPNVSTDPSEDVSTESAISTNSSEDVGTSSNVSTDLSDDVSAELNVSTDSSDDVSAEPTVSTDSSDDVSAEPTVSTNTSKDVSQSASSIVMRLNSTKAFLNGKDIAVDPSKDDVSPFAGRV